MPCLGRSLGLQGEQYNWRRDAPHSDLVSLDPGTATRWKWMVYLAGNGAKLALVPAVARIRVNVRATRSRTAIHSASLALLAP